MDKGKKTTISIKVKLLLIALLPSIILSATLAYLAASNIQAGIQEQALNGLRGVAFSLQEVYSTADAGEYATDASGNVMKGNLAISGNYAIVDEMKNFTGYEFTVFYGDTRVTTSLKDINTGERLIGTKASDTVIQTVLQGGQEFSDTGVIINGESYYGYYLPIIQNGTVIGMTFSGLPTKDADAFIQEKVSAILGTAIIVLIVMLVVGLIFSLSLGRALANAEKVIGEIAKGNLNVEVDEKSKKRGDEIGAMTRELQNLVTELVRAITNVKNSSKVLFTAGTSLEEMASQCSNTTNEINRAVEDVSRGAMTQAEETETASMNIVEMGNIITNIVESVDSLGQASLNMKHASDESTIIIQELSQSNDKTTEAIEKIGEQVHTTNDSVQAIRQAVELITSIATETNLLSLNASIEAARAGEHGRGFAVVASEIQKLADESNQSAQEIGRIIDNLLKQSEQTVVVMDEVNIIVNEQREKLNQTKEQFSLVNDGVVSTRKETEEIEKLVASCDVARAKIMDVIQNLSAISEENAASTEETNASMEELNANLNLLAESSRDLLELSTELEQNMAFFQI